jgi:hypothetical protein
MSTQVTCRECGALFTPTYRAGRFTGQGGKLGHPPAPRSFTEAQFCGNACRQANYRWRKARERQQGAAGEAPAPWPWGAYRSAVTGLPEPSIFMDPPWAWKEAA